MTTTVAVPTYPTCLTCDGRHAPGTCHRYVIECRVYREGLPEGRTEVTNGSITILVNADREMWQLKFRNACNSIRALMNIDREGEL